MLTVNTSSAGLVANAVGNKRPASCKIVKNDNPNSFAIVTGPIATTMTFSMVYNSCYAAIPACQVYVATDAATQVYSHNITALTFDMMQLGMLLSKHHAALLIMRNDDHDDDYNDDAPDAADADDHI